MLVAGVRPRSNAPLLEDKRREGNKEGGGDLKATNAAEKEGAGDEERGGELG